MNFVARVMAGVSAAALVAGCQRTPPRVPGPEIVMAMPAPPARLVIPVELPEPPPAEPVVVEAPPPAPVPVRREPVVAARPVERPAPPTVETPPPVLSTTVDTLGTERQIQQLLSAAQQNLSRVSYRELSANARAQYDEAKSMIRRADDALKVKNYMFAEFLAKRAESVARLLVRG